MVLVYIGEGFYLKSGTMMSPLYTEKEFLRSDWGMVRTALSKGETVIIRPANEEEMKIAKRMLITLRKDLRKKSYLE